MTVSFYRKVHLYWHTLRYLKPVQIYGRFLFRLRRPKPDLRTAPTRNSPSGTWQMPAMRLPCMTDPRSWLFLNKTGKLDEIGWHGSHHEKLWRYNQHYFDDLNAIGARARMSWHSALLKDWVEHNPPCKGEGWEPYPTSLRIVNWVKWALAGNELPEQCIQSLAVQARWLRQRLEVHLQGNHLFANAKALIYVGLFFEGREATDWLSVGFKILEREIPEQILSDGGHFERSTMYHSLAYEDMLDLINVSSAFQEACRPWSDISKEWHSIAMKMGHWLRAMCHPDGEIGLFNDAAFGIAPTPNQLFSYAARLNSSSPIECMDILYLKASGYIRACVGSAVLLIDVAPIGPNYLPGHAHADTLSFELSVAGHRLFVNSGTSCYGNSAERSRQRGTAAHNTVVVNGQNSSEVWGGFRVARRAYPHGLYIEQSADTTTKVSCAHNGYDHLHGSPTHHRTWLMDAHGLTVTDWVEGPHQSAEARFHFHPEVKVHTGPGQTEGTVALPDGTVMTWQLDNGHAWLEPSTWHPRFGHVEPNECLAVKLVDGSCSLHLRWGTSRV